MKLFIEEIQNSRSHTIRCTTWKDLIDSNIRVLILSLVAYSHSLLFAPNKLREHLQTHCRSRQPIH